jgi:hypothetical protein
MEPNKSLDESVRLIAALLHDIQTSHGAVFNCRALRLTIKKVEQRVLCEGFSFLTKTLPRLGKALDKALSGGSPLNAASLGFKPIRKGSNLPMFLGELISRVLSHDGVPLHNSCAICVGSIRLITYCFYKYELPYEDKDCEKVVSSFEKTERDLVTTTVALRKLRASVDAWVPVTYNKRSFRVHGGSSLRVSSRLSCTFSRCKNRFRKRYGYKVPRSYIPSTFKNGSWQSEHKFTSYYDRFSYNRSGLVSYQRGGLLSSHNKRKFTNVGNGSLKTTLIARSLLSELFANFDPTDIYPRHGPGAVATRQQLWEKYLWNNVSSRITRMYPLDEYFYACLGHVCDTYQGFRSLKEESLPARVILVPKDSRGPRLISCEPVDFQWVQQGLGRAVVHHVESHRLTKHNVFFTNQRTNQIGALLGSSTGKYATLDLKEASDRVSVELVHLLFPSRIVEYLDSCRSLSTVLPDGREISLQKYAPMGSCLCFPIMALTIWAILAASARDTDARESIAVYGDDVIVQTAEAANAIEQLESYGLLVNRDKSCTGGFFRESCGTDAFKGVDVTPVRFRTVWSSSRRPDVYTSWIAYANELYDRHYFSAYDYIVGRLHHVYGDIPDASFQNIGEDERLRVVADERKPKRVRTNVFEQRLEYNVWTVSSPLIKKFLRLPECDEGRKSFCLNGLTGRPGTSGKQHRH